MEPMPTEKEVPEGIAEVPQFVDWYPGWDEDEQYFSVSKS